MDDLFNEKYLACTKLKGPSRILEITFRDVENGLGDKTSYSFTNANWSDSWTLIQTNEMASKIGEEGMWIH